MEQGMIRFNDVSRRYASPAGDYQALQGIELQIRSGEYIAVVGKSGSGKSTLLNLLAGIDHPTEGHVLIDGLDIHTMGESELAGWRGRNIGVVFQFFQLIPTLTTGENMMIAMEFVNKIPREERPERIDRLLEQVGILDQRDKYPSALSGGEQQRAAIARALVNDPPILVADEPTGNLDEHTSGAINEIFADLVAAGKTVIVVTHEAVERSKFHRIIRLKDGRIAEDARSLTEAGQ